MGLVASKRFLVFSSSNPLTKRWKTTSYQQQLLWWKKHSSNNNYDSNNNNNNNNNDNNNNNNNNNNNSNGYLMSNARRILLCLQNNTLHVTISHCWLWRSNKARNNLYWQDALSKFDTEIYQCRNFWFAS